MSPNIIRLGSVPSTMSEAAKLAAEGCEHGTAVVAEAQTAGMGRHGHSWHSEPGTGLYCSVVLRLALGAAELPLLTLALGLAVGEAIQLSTGLSCDLRWPNDILAGERKVSGILVQIVDNAAIAGIGINVNQTGFPAELERDANSILLATGRETDREALLIQLLKSVEDLCQVLTTQDGAAILKLFSRASSYVNGKRVRVDLGFNRFWSGTTCGITDQGFLQLRKEDGMVETVISGGVRPA